MKSFTLILSLTILFLAIKPGIEQMCLKADTIHNCCGSASTDNMKDENKKDDCDQNTCNPFSDCNSCTIAFLNVENEYVFNPSESYRNIIILPVSSVSHFASEFWQPPKSV